MIMRKGNVACHVPFGWHFTAKTTTRRCAGWQSPHTDDPERPGHEARPFAMLGRLCSL